jgi:membrane protein
MAFFPTILLLLSLIPFIPIPELEGQLLTTFAEMLPTDVYLFVEETLRDLTKKRSTLLSFTFLVVLYLASNSMNAILMGFSTSSNITKKRNALTQRLISIALIIVLSLMLFIAILLITTSGTVINYLASTGFTFDLMETIGVVIAKWLVVLLLISTSIAVLFNAGDTHSREFQLVSPGVILSTLLVVIASQSMVWVFNNISDYNALYGSIGAIIAVQVWIYVNMIILLVGFELDTSIDKAKRVEDTVLRPQLNED